MRIHQSLYTTFLLCIACFLYQNCSRVSKLNATDKSNNLAHGVPPQSGTSSQGFDSCNYVSTPSSLQRLTEARVQFVESNSIFAAVDVLHYESVFGFNPAAPSNSLLSWPGLGNQSILLTLQQNSYIALEFEVPADDGFYSLEIDSNPAWSTAGVSLSVSECPGDFHGISQCRLESGETSSLHVTSYLSANSCVLEAGKRYYLNLIQAPIDNLSSSYCEEETCLASLRVSPSLVP